MHYVVNLVGGSKEPIKSIATIESIALVLAYFTNKRIITLLIYYGGRIGYGKEYRERLLGKWEVMDVNDCCSYALYLLDFGKIYGKHLSNTKIFHVEGSSPVSYRKPVIFADDTYANQTAGNTNFAPVFVQRSLTSVRNWLIKGIENWVISITLHLLQSTTAIKIQLPYQVHLICTHFKTIAAVGSRGCRRSWT
ncbi:hypothetical protein ACFX1X_024594 [Malus domestica]